MDFRKEQEYWHDQGLIFQLLECLPARVFWKSKEGVYLGCNTAFAHSVGFHSPDEITGKSDYDLPVKKEDSDSYRQDDLEVMESRVPKLDIEEVQHLSDGRQIYLKTSKVPFVDSGGEVLGVLGIYHDITDLKVSENMAHKASQVKSEFIANMSHDLRTPMTGVMGMLMELAHLEGDIREAVKDQPRALSCSNEVLKRTTEYVSIAKGSTDELLDMFNDILETIRLDSGKVDAEPESFELDKEIQKQVTLLAATAKEKELDLRFEIAPGTPNSFFGLRRLLDRILVNLISNALKFTDEGSVTLKASCVSGDNDQPGKTATIEIVVEDTGIGIPEDKFDEIFENFSRLTSSYRGVYKGTGLGLYAVKNYVDAMSGHIRVESKENEGSRFILTLPLEISKACVSSEAVSQEASIKEPATFDEHLMQEKEKKEKQSDRKALITEDNMAAAAVVKTMLRRLGFDSHHAKSGEEAIKMASERDYMIILMDIGLPDISGIDATRGIRKLDHSTRSQVPIIALTGHENKRDYCIESGMQDLICKPASKEKIQVMIERYVTT